ncbi:hypothetical protein ACQKH5_03450 [Hyphomonas sp. NPDC076900]|uniref:hypothetical protein n=1 Tax=unclassified Hyphomonas TaxID=2630699 RepID=UPI003D0838F1
MEIPGQFSAEINTEALQRSLGTSRARIKVAAGWSGANERTVKNWFSGKYGPSGEHLVGLMRHSDDVLQAVLELSGREGLSNAIRIRRAEQIIRELLTMLHDI